MGSTPASRSSVPTGAGQSTAIKPLIEALKPIPGTTWGQLRTEMRGARARGVQEEHRACEHLHEMEAARKEFLEFRAQTQTELRDAVARNVSEEHLACEHLHELEATRTEFLEFSKRQSKRRVVAQG